MLDALFKLFSEEVTEAKKKTVNKGLLVSYRLIVFAGIAYLVFDRVEQKQFREDDYRFRAKTEFSLFMDSAHWQAQQTLNSNLFTQIGNLNTDNSINKGDIKQIKGRLRMD